MTLYHGTQHPEQVTQAGEGLGDAQETRRKLAWKLYLDGVTVLSQNPDEGGASLSLFHILFPSHNFSECVLTHQKCEKILSHAKTSTLVRNKHRRH